MKDLMHSDCLNKSVLTVGMIVVSGLIINANAQDAIAKRASDHRPKQLYVSVGVGMTAPGDEVLPNVVAANFTLANGWGGGFRFSVAKYRTPDVPIGYNGPSMWYSDISSGLFNKVTSISLLAIRRWRTWTPLLTYGIAAGPAYVTYEENSFLPILSPTQTSGKYYKEVTKKHVPGLSLRGYVLFMPGRHLGLELGAFGNINAAKSNGAIEVCINFGHMRERLRNKQSASTNH